MHVRRIARAPEHAQIQYDLARDTQGDNEIWITAYIDPRFAELVGRSGLFALKWNCTLEAFEWTPRGCPGEVLGVASSSKKVVRENMQLEYLRACVIQKKPNKESALLQEIMSNNQKWSQFSEKLNGKIAYKEKHFIHPTTGRDLGPCHEWTGSQFSGFNYGRIKFGGLTFHNHTALFNAKIGMVPEGLVLCHRCNNPSCCNHNHFLLGTQADNRRDAERTGKSIRGSANPSHEYPERVARGTRHGNSKLPIATVKCIKATYNMHCEVRGIIKAIAAELNLNLTTTRLIARGTTWKSDTADGGNVIPLEKLAPHLNPNSGSAHPNANPNLNVDNVTSFYKQCQAEHDPIERKNLVRAFARKVGMDWRTAHRISKGQHYFLK